jgi:hypothetical protein
VDLDGREICLEHLDASERALLARLRRRARTNPDWDAFDNYWTRTVPGFYKARGLARKAVPRTTLWRIAQDLSSRLGLAAGLVRPDDYLGDLEDLIREKYPSPHAFCRATGLAAELLEPVLAGRADLPLGTLLKGLERIGYTLRVQPLPEVTPAAAARKKRTG